MLQLLSLQFQILLTGKSINFLRQVCQDRTSIRDRDVIKAAETEQGTSLHFIHLIYAGFPASEKIMETWKMKKTFSRPRKIMEFGKSPKNMEKSCNLVKSWNFVSDLKLYESRRAFQVSVIHAFVHFIVTIFSYSYLFGTCTLKKWKYFWNNHGKISHGIRF